MGRLQPVTTPISAHGGHPKAGAASRPIAGKPGSHRHRGGLETGYISVGAGLLAMRPVLTTQRWGGVRSGSEGAGAFRHTAALGIYNSSVTDSSNR